jgi:urease accessory protein
VIGGRLLRILHLASPALPIGAFHFSQGLEYAVEAGWVRDEATAVGWVGGLASHALGTLDLPILLRLHRACSMGACDDVQRWSQFLIAARETEELRAEDRHMGTALARILREFGLGTEVGTMQRQPSYAAMFALACVHWDVCESQTLQAYAWAWAENQTLAAVKLVPLGQSAGQRILHALVPRLEEVVERAFTIDEQDIGTAALMQGVASARHECQYTRLFKS